MSVELSPIASSTDSAATPSPKKKQRGKGGRVKGNPALTTNHTQSSSHCGQAAQRHLNQIIEYFINNEVETLLIDKVAKLYPLPNDAWSVSKPKFKTFLTKTDTTNRLVIKGKYVSVVSTRSPSLSNDPTEVSNHQTEAELLKSRAEVARLQKEMQELKASLSTPSTSIPDGIDEGTNVGSNTPDHPHTEPVAKERRPLTLTLHEQKQNHFNDILNYVRTVDSVPMCELATKFPLPPSIRSTSGKHKFAKFLKAADTHRDLSVNNGKISLTTPKVSLATTTPATTTTTTTIETLDPLTRNVAGVTDDAVNPQQPHNPNQNNNPQQHHNLQQNRSQRGPLDDVWTNKANINEEHLKLMEVAVADGILQVNLPPWMNQKNNPDLTKKLMSRGVQKNLMTAMILEATKGTAHHNKEKIYQATQAAHLEKEVDETRTTTTKSHATNTTKAAADDDNNNTDDDDDTDETYASAFEDIVQQQSEKEERELGQQEEKKVLEEVNGQAEHNEDEQDDVHDQGPPPQRQQHHQQQSQHTPHAYFGIAREQSPTTPTTTPTPTSPTREQLLAEVWSAMDYGASIEGEMETPETQGTPHAIALRLVDAATRWLNLHARRLNVSITDLGRLLVGSKELRDALDRSHDGDDDDGIPFRSPSYTREPEKARISALVEATWKLSQHDRIRGRSIQSQDYEQTHVRTMINTAKSGEDEVAEALTIAGIGFKTEVEQLREQSRSETTTANDQDQGGATPDFIFSEGHTFQLHNTTINWIEVKHKCLLPRVSCEEEFEKFIKQITKYRTRFGTGAVVWTKPYIGFCQRIQDVVEGVVHVQPKQVPMPRPSHWKRNPNQHPHQNHNQHQNHRRQQQQHHHHNDDNRFKQQQQQHPYHHDDHSRVHDHNSRFGINPFFQPRRYPSSLEYGFDGLGEVELQELYSTRSPMSTRTAALMTAHVAARKSNSFLANMLVKAPDTNTYRHPYHGMPYLSVISSSSSSLRRGGGGGGGQTLGGETESLSGASVVARQRERFLARFDKQKPKPNDNATNNNDNDNDNDNTNNNNANDVVAGDDECNARFSEFELQEEGLLFCDELEIDNLAMTLDGDDIYRLSN